MIMPSPSAFLKIEDTSLVSLDIRPGDAVGFAPQGGELETGRVYVVRRDKAAPAVAMIFRRDEAGERFEPADKAATGCLPAIVLTDATIVEGVGLGVHRTVW